MHCFPRINNRGPDVACHCHTIALAIAPYLKVSDVGEEEADKGECQGPLRDGADDVRSIALSERGRGCYCHRNIHTPTHTGAKVLPPD